MYIWKNIYIYILDTCVLFGVCHAVSKPVKIHTHTHKMRQINIPIIHKNM